MRVLVVSPHPIGTADSGDRRRTADLVAALPRQGVEPVLLEFVWGETPCVPDLCETVRVRARPEGGLRRLVWRARLAARRVRDPYAIHYRSFISTAVGEVIEKCGIDLVDFQHSFMWAPVSSPSVVTFHNVEFDRRSATGIGSERGRRNVFRREALAVQSAPVVVFSNEDADRVRRLYGGSATTVVPIGLASPESSKERQRPTVRRALFVGSMDYEPNREAADFLVSWWQTDRDRHELSELVIVGRKASTIRADGVEGIRVVGDAPSVQPYLLDADLALIPLASGGGVRVKVLEALSVGLPIIATEIGVEGLRLASGTHAMVLRSRAGLTDAVRQLRSTPERSKLAANGLALFRNLYSADAMASGMAEVYHQVLR